VRTLLLALLLVLAGCGGSSLHSPDGQGETDGVIGADGNGETEGVR
jgi:hypothetical protein